MRVKLLSLLVVMASFSVSDVSADLITWGSSQDIFQGDAADVSFVSTNGVLVDALNAGVIGAANNVTVNGVAFEAAGSTPGSAGNNTDITSQSGAFTFTDQNSNTNVFNNTNLGPFPAGGAVDTLLESGSFSIESVTLNNLVIGQEYEIQVFVSDSRSNGLNAITGFSDGVNPDAIVASVDRNNNTSGVPLETNLNVGDFIIGTFTADSDSLTFATSSTLSGPNGLGQINAIQLRNVTVAVPEPSSLALLGLGFAGLVARRRK